MGSSKVQEIERAIGALTQQELEELRVWLDEYAGPQAIDKRIQKDVAAGRLDKFWPFEVQPRTSFSAVQESWRIAGTGALVCSRYIKLSGAGG